MQIRISFPKIHDEHEEDLVYIFMECFIFRVDTLLYRTPDYLIEGNDRLFLNIYGLSVKEADIVYDEGIKEARGDGLIKKIVKLESDLEEDIGNFEYTRPDFKEGVREELEENKGFNKKLDIQKFVGGAIESVMKMTVKLMFEEYYNENSKAPITEVACFIAWDFIDWDLALCDDDPDFKEEYMARHIAYIPMEKNRKVRKPRAPRKPRARRSENNRCFEYS